MSALIVGNAISLLACACAFGLGCAWMHRRQEEKWAARLEEARDWAYEQGMADMYASKKQAYRDWQDAIRRPSLVAGVAEAEGRHRVLDSPTAEFDRIMRAEFIEEGTEL